jgi:transcription initiation factor TFIID subunit TAF12
MEADVPQTWKKLVLACAIFAAGAPTALAQSRAQRHLDAAAAAEGQARDVNRGTTQRLQAQQQQQLQQLQNQNLQQQQQIQQQQRDTLRPGGITGATCPAGSVGC